MRLCVKKDDTLAIIETVQKSSGESIALDVPAHFDKAWIQISHSAKAGFDMNTGLIVDPDCSYEIAIGSTIHPQLSSFDRIYSADANAILNGNTNTGTHACAVQVVGAGIVLSNLPEMASTISVVDLRGKILFRGEKAVGVTQLTLSTESLGSGIRIIQIQTGASSAVKKVSVIR